MVIEKPERIINITKGITAMSNEELKQFHELAMKRNAFPKKKRC
ncbi:hypothetical protein [Iningainema tapete]|nr:hypothetical protein [Iningainema tapete]